MIINHSQETVRETGPCQCPTLIFLNTAVPSFYLVLKRLKILSSYPFPIVPLWESYFFLI